MKARCCAVAWRAIAASALGLCAAGASAQQLFTYTQFGGGANTRPLGYPVPIPVASLTPLDGFRSYESLHARHQQLALESPDVAGFEVGRTQQYGRTIWAYVLGDADALTRDGEAEGSIIINAATHAREWQAPEVSTGIMEHLVANAGDEAVVRYVLDNVHVVLIPVQNIDGFLQTQRTPAQVVVGQDPNNARDWPRDGRMRRKNMRGVDEVIATFGDHLGGIDLNRNHGPYWGPSSSGSSAGSPNPASLTFYGAGVHSEAENLALENAIALADPARLRMGEDIHSFAMVFYTSNTGDAAVNAAQNRLVARLQSHHVAASASTRFPNGRFYANIPDPVGFGIGAAAEFFADEYRIPAWTLELEPGGNGSRDYGGSGDSHDGFILPAAEIRRVRDAWASTHVLAFYHQAGPPHLAAVAVRDVVSGELRYAAHWRRVGNARWLVRSTDAPLLAGRSYRIVTRYSKPMRVRSSGAVVAFAGISAPLDPEIALVRGDVVTPAPIGRWLLQDMLHYRDDSHAADLAVPAGSAAGMANLRVAVQDLAALGLDADPRTPAGYRAGWVGYEEGAADTTHAIAVASSDASVVRASISRLAVAAGGEFAVLLDRRSAGPALTISVDLVDAPGSLSGEREASWAAGESGFRRLHLRAPSGAAEMVVQLTTTVGTARLPQAALTLAAAPSVPPEIE